MDSSRKRNEKNTQVKAKKREMERKGDEEEEEEEEERQCKSSIFALGEARLQHGYYWSCWWCWWFWIRCVTAECVDVTRSAPFVVVVAVVIVSFVYFAIKKSLQRVSLYLALLLTYKMSAPPSSILTVQHHTTIALCCYCCRCLQSTLCVCVCVGVSVYFLNYIIA